MLTTPKSLRLQIGLLGRINVGKSSFLNMIAGQDVSIISDTPGTTTDVVEKTMELHTVGPVVFLDTAGINDETPLGGLRRQKTRQVVNRCDVVVLVAEPDVWTDYEQGIIEEAQASRTPVMTVVNKTDLIEPAQAFIDRIQGLSDEVLLCSSKNWAGRNDYVTRLEQKLFKMSPYEYYRTPQLMADLMPKGGVAVLVAPIDMEAPKGRIKMLQVQTIREALDNHMISMIVKETEYEQALARLSKAPDLVICDSPVIGEIIAKTPKGVACTTFSTLLSRFKGDLIEQARGAAVIDSLKDGDKVLIAEACTHHAIDEDIGRVKIPNGLKHYTQQKIQIDICSGRDFPEDLSSYKLVIHCGGCMLTRKEMLHRIHDARLSAVSITNYGICISLLQGVLKEVLQPFPEALRAYEMAKQGKDAACLL